MSAKKEVKGLYSEDKPTKQYVEKPRVDWFVKFVNFSNKYFDSLGKGAKLTKEQREVFEFLNYRITGEQFRAAEIAAMFLGLFVTIFAVLILAIIFGAGSPFFLIGSLLCFMAPLAAFMLVAFHPQQEAKREQTMALGYLSEIVNYMVASMRLTPNLEKAVEFTASHGRGKIAEDMKKLIWDVQIGKYLSVEEGLDDLAYRWGKYNEDFKQALMLIRSSLLESDDAKREILLEKASADVLEGSKEKMDQFARALSQPTVYLYYFGVLLPLMLAIVLPIGGTLSGGDFPLARPEILALIYIVALPIGIYFLGINILGNRPPTYVAPEIREDYPGLPPKGTMNFLGASVPVLPIALIILLIVLGAGFYLDQIITVAPLDLYEKADALAAVPHIELFGIPPTELFTGLFSLLGVVVGLGFAISIYLYGTYIARKKVQDEIRAMEREFKDAIYVLASRLGENRPLEDALKYAVAFLPNSKVASKIFRKILDNVTTMGMTIDEAVFNPQFGALKNLPSKTIQSGMRITIDSIGLGVNVAAKSLIGLALQLRNSEKIDLLLNNLLSSVTQMLKTMGTFIAPIVLGVVTSLQGVIVKAMSSNCADTPSAATTPGVSGFGGASNLSSMFCSKTGEASSSTDPATFTFIMGIYVLEVVILLTYFNSQVEDSNNKLHTYIEIAKALPVATLIFAAVAYFAGTSIGV